ncbi:MAG TPA: polysaccharide biosynthesis/export family protein, partial [Bacteroidales bacterium]|nr:polysaccharide biosynthesis/export family protein [Bacteroidales bacterium]
MKAARLYMLLVCVAMLLVSCAPNSVKRPASADVMNQQARTYAQTPQEYVIEVGDSLDIKFMYNAELNELAVPVRPDGKISLQLAQDIPAAGSTPTQLRKVLYDKYAAELKNTRNC